MVTQHGDDAESAYLLVESARYLIAQDRQVCLARHHACLITLARALLSFRQRLVRSYIARIGSLGKFCMSLLGSVVREPPSSGRAGAFGLEDWRVSGQAGKCRLADGEE